MVYIILGQGFEEVEAVAPGDILRRGGVEVRYAAAGSSLSVPGSVGITLQADVLARDIAPKKGDTLVVPGGMGGVNTIKHDDAVMAMIAKAAENGAELAAICAGPSVLAKLGLLFDQRQNSMRARHPLDLSGQREERHQIDKRQPLEEQARHQAVVLGHLPHSLPERFHAIGLFNI